MDKQTPIIKVRIKPMPIASPISCQWATQRKPFNLFESLLNPSKAYSYLLSYWFFDQVSRLNDQAFLKAGHVR